MALRRVQLNPFSSESKYLDDNGDLYNSQQAYDDHVQQRNLQSQQQQQAQTFRQNLPSYQRQIGEGLRSQEAGQLSQNLDDIGTNFSRRGLLYSGMHEKDKANARGVSAKNLATKMSKANTQLEDTADQMESGAISTGMAIRNAQQAAQNQLYAQAMAQQNSSNAFIGGIAQMGLLGTFLK